ncbi:hypothetical protein [Frankia sp. R82]|uniref:hypothetical protein n=1 Tax=Frankia sp. R82 TaxID=2950553 RepID=UPI0020444BD9|nr:hypothetical protein [Frankia sp. R82]MCM3882347.1 hypothetical protein [Frankia sp. R82]
MATAPNTIVDLLPRRSALVRSSASCRSEGQVPAANIDLVVLVAASCSSPRRDRRRVVLVAASSTEPALGRIEGLPAPARESSGVRGDPPGGLPGPGQRREATAGGTSRIPDEAGL